MSILRKYLVGSFQGSIAFTRAHRELCVHGAGKTLGLLALKLPELSHDPLIPGFGPGVMLNLVGELPELGVDQLDLRLERGLCVGILRRREILGRNHRAHSRVNDRNLEWLALVHTRTRGAVRRRCPEQESSNPGSRALPPIDTKRSSKPDHAGTLRGGRLVLHRLEPGPDRVAVSASHTENSSTTALVIASRHAPTCWVGGGRWVCGAEVAGIAGVLACEWALGVRRRDSRD
jgi:hypothetical protein